ncbi:MAG TPA: hypothetical protein VFC26_00400 [Verrucomicrobiae bacterium]|nr:hypothetical protein [Verrucomicrobiae bacterium]
MKTIWLAALLATCAQAQNVFLLGSNTTPPPDLNGYSAPPATAAAAPAAANVVVNVNANGASPACTYPAANPYYAQYNNGYYPQQQYYSPNVMYIGGPGTCGPNYYNNYYSYPSSSVIYFGGLQAYRHGYNFRHCR